MKKTLITAVALIAMGASSAMALSFDVYNSTQTSSIESWITTKGGYVTLLEDFESEAAGWYETLNTSVGEFTAGGEAGIGATSCNSALDCTNTDAPQFSIQDRDNSWYGRFNTTEGADSSQWLDSGDITELNLAVDSTLQSQLTNLFFYIQDPSDVGAKTTINGNTVTTGYEFTGKSDGGSFFFGITLAENETLESIQWLVSSANDGYGLDDFSTVAAAPVPEPATMLLFGTGLAGLAGIARRRQKNK